jgi:hypothetical protein
VVAITTFLPSVHAVAPAAAGLGPSALGVAHHYTEVLWIHHHPLASVHLRRVVGASSLRAYHAVIRAAVFERRCIGVAHYTAVRRVRPSPLASFLPPCRLIITTLLPSIHAAV